MSTRCVIQRHTPCLFKLLHNFRIGHFLVSREIAGLCTHIAGTLYIVLTTQRIDTTAFAAKFTYQEGHI